MKLHELCESGMKHRVTGRKPDDFATYLRSVNDIKEAINSIYGEGKYSITITLDYVIALFAHHNMVVTDSVILHFTPDEIFPYREYDRTFRDEGPLRWTGKLTVEEYEDLKRDIIQNGIKDPIWLTLRRRMDGDVEVYLGEGNHRLRIAKELGIDTVPIQFNYYK
jgi:hypothetical protein